MNHSRLLIRMFALCICLAVLATGCDRSTQESITEEEYAVYSAMYEGSSGFSLGTGYALMLVYDHTNLGVQPDELDRILEYLRQKWPALTPEVFSDYKAKNAQPHPLKPALGFAIPHKLVGEQEAKELCQNPDQSACWDALRAKYPDARGIVYLSRVAFNSQMDKALVFQGSACCGTGGGGFFLMRKDKGVWVVEDRAVIWVS